MIIGIHGKKGAGKTTLARAIQNWLNSGVAQLSFATTLKDMLKVFLVALVGGERADYYTSAKTVTIPELGVDYRHLMQTLGTEWGKGLVQTDVWVTIADKISQKGVTDYTIYDDVRFENEATYVRQQGGVIIHLFRPMDSNDDHSSEAGIAFRPDLKDIYVLNEGDLTDLQEWAKAFAKVAIGESV
jgi:hypothetical protein